MFKLCVFKCYLNAECLVYICVHKNVKVKLKEVCNKLRVLSLYCAACAIYNVQRLQYISQTKTV